MPMQLRKASRTINLFAVLALSDWLFFGFVSPRAASSSVVIIGCLLLGATLYALCRVSVFLVSMAAPVAEGSRRRLAFCVALPATFMLLLQSIGQLSWRDAFAAIPFAAITYIYWGYIVRQKVAH